MDKTNKKRPSLHCHRDHLLALHAYLVQLSDSQVAFGVKQRMPKDLDEAVSTTIELESYLVPKGIILSIVQESDDNEPVGVTK